MAKTLYIADLDGTLLDREGWLSEYTIQTVRRMHAEGHLFTVATARSLHSANDLLWYLGIQLPVVLTNGALLYDSVHERFLQVSGIPLEALPKVLWIVESYLCCGFLYALRDDRLSIYYREMRNEWDRVYREDRIERFEGRVYQVEDLLSVARHNLPAYMVTCGPLQTLAAIQRDLEGVLGISCEIYNDIYNNSYFMDIFSSSASKARGMLEVQKMVGADEIVAFGDNFNDMQMLLAADRAYVPKNGLKVAQNVATGILDYAHNDGVARFLSAELGWG